MNDRKGAGATTAPVELPAAWRARAFELRAFGSDERAALLWERAADELEAASRAASDEPLTLKQAEQLSGFHRDHIARLMRTGRLANVGRRYAPRVRRGDLPLKAGAANPPPDLPRIGSPPHIGRAEIARAVIHRHLGGA